MIFSYKDFYILIDHIVSINLYVCSKSEAYSEKK